jgi:hypothetical protein
MRGWTRVSLAAALGVMLLPMRTGCLEVLANTEAADFPASPLPEPSPAAPSVEQITEAPSKAQPADGSVDLLVKSIILVESGGRPDAVSHRGARGLMQVKAGAWADTTAKIFGRKLPFAEAFNPDLNEEVGRAYLAHLQAFIRENRAKWLSDERSLLLGCYNAGPKAVADAGFCIQRLSFETRDYICRCSALHDLYLRQLAAAAPMELVQAR